MSLRDERLGAVLRPARVDPTAVVERGWTAIRADDDPTAGSVWLIEHAVTRHSREQRLAVIVAERRPWGETVDWLIECMNRVPPEQVPAGATSETAAVVRRYCADEFPGSGAFGRLSEESVPVVREAISEAARDARWGVIDERQEWDDAADVTRAVRDADLLRVRATHDFVFWAKRGCVVMAEELPINPGSRTHPPP